MAKVLALIERGEHEGPEGTERGRARADTVRRSAGVLLTLARRLGEPVAVVGGAPPTEQMIRTLGRYGATEIWCADPGGSAVTNTDVLTTLARGLEPAAILIPGSYRGQETAARLAVRLDAGIITDAVDVRTGPGGEPVAVQRCLAGSYSVESSVVRGIPIITVSPEAAVPEPHPVEPVLHTVAVEPARTRAPRITAVPRPRSAQPVLDQADIVVAGGRGVGSRAAFAVLAEVADALGAAVAGSHTAVELGWVPPEARVGLTGKTVHPDLYLACGVSGSVRHRAGMQGAKTVVAIGDDPDAPIFKLADLGVVGDAGAILPALLAEIRARAQIQDPRQIQDPTQLRGHIGEQDPR